MNTQTKFSRVNSTTRASIRKNSEELLLKSPEIKLAQSKFYRSKPVESQDRNRLPMLATFKVLGVDR